MKEERPRGLHETLAQLDMILDEAQTVYSHEVELLIHDKCRDPKRIEYLLDGLLDFCFYPEMLRLYKKVCRHYFDINPEATADYVGFYRELWDSENDDY